jgi:chorismate dehydratase
VIRCGRISYTNDLPVYAAFDAGAVEFPGTLVSGVPTELNAMLLAGALDVSPISSFFYAQHADALVLLPWICIGSRREVRSIYCISKTPPAALSGVAIYATTESATGRNLFSTICAERFGFSPTYVDSNDPFEASRTAGAPCLLIGDKAIDAAFQAERHDVYDVGDLWHTMTGREMVYAVWAVSREVVSERRDEVDAVWRALLSAEQWGTVHRDRVIAAAEAIRPRHEDFYLDYYLTLNFNFDEHAQLGLERFFALAAKHGLLKSAPQLEFFNEVPSHV